MFYSILQKIILKDLDLYSLVMVGGTPFLELSEAQQYFSALYLLEIGKINKSRLIKNFGSVSLLSFIEEGARLRGSDLSLLSFCDQLEVKRLNLALLDVENNVLGGWTLIKDSTASSLQH